jgi:hypothetical protein
MKNLWLRKQISVVIVLVLGSITSIHAQESTFSVLKTQGVVEGLKPSTTTWFRVLPIDHLPLQTKIRLSANSYATFLSAEGVLVEFDKKGEYTLTPTKKPKQLSAFEKIVNFINQAMKTNEQSDLAGSISRDASGKVTVVFPFDTKLLSSSVRLMWLSETPTTKFVVTVADEAGEKVFAKEILDTTLLLNLTKDIPSFKRGHCYYWNVGVAGNSGSLSSQYCLLPLKEDDSLQIVQERKQLFAEIAESLPSEKSPLRRFSDGAWYETKNLYVDAYEQYRVCAALMPTVDLYRNAPATLLGKLRQKKQ